MAITSDRRGASISTRSVTLQDPSCMEVPSDVLLEAACEDRHLCQADISERHLNRCMPTG